MLIEKLDSTYDPSEWLINWFSGGEPTASGEHVNEDTAMRIPAVRATINVRAEAMEVLPIQIFRKEKSGRQTLVDDHPVLDLLNRKPNEEIAAPEMWYGMQRDSDLFGNGFAVIQRTGRGDPVGLWKRDARPEKTKMMRDPKTKKLFFRCRDEQGQDQDDVPLEDMLHVKYNSKNTLAGKSPVNDLKEAIGGNKAAERYCNELFANGAALEGHYTSPKKMSLPAYQRLTHSIEESAQHGNRHKRPLLEEGMTFEQVTFDANNVQMIEGRNFMIVEVARIWRVNPYLIFVAAYGAKAPAELFREFMMLTMMAVCTMWKGAIDLRLLKPPYSCQFDMKKFMEGDPAAQSAWYRTMFTIGYYSLNEIRREQGANPIVDSTGKPDPNADEHFVPRNMIPLSKCNDSAWALGKNGADGVTPAPGAVSGGDGSTPAEPGDLPATEARSANQAALFDPRVEQLAASEAVLTAAIHRMERIARNEAIRAAKDPAKYSARLDAFWIDHGKVLEEALRLPLRAVAAIRGPANGFHSTDEELSAMIGEYTQEKREALLKAAECRPEELAARVAEAVKDWGCP